MITLNYCTKAIPDFIKQYNYFNKINWPKSSESSFNIAELLKISQKFLIPDGNELLNSDIILSKEDLLSDLYHLPYNIIALEYSLSLDHAIISGNLHKECTKRIALAKEHLVDDIEGILIIPIWCDESKSNIATNSPSTWVAAVCGAFIPYNQNIKMQSSIIFNNEIKITPVLLFDEVINTGLIPEDQYNNLLNDLMDEVLAICKFLAAYNCKNVITEVIPPSTKLNRKRIDNGQLPFSEYKVLKIDINNNKKYSRSVSEVSSRTSPRCHTRRGHIRTCKSGIRVYVKPTIVNPNSKFTVEKDYLFIK